MKTYTVTITCLLVAGLWLAGCGPSEQERANQLATAVDATVVAVPTATPLPTFTPFPTLTPNPTLTPYPTYTPVPPTATATPIATQVMGDTVIGARFQVKVTKAETAEKFGTYSMQAGSKNHMVIITLDYTLLGRDPMPFYPEGVFLAYIGDSELSGWVQAPSLYKGKSSFVTDFSRQAIYNYMNPGDNLQNEQFVYTFPKDYTDFLLYFPETAPIMVKLK